ncbi:MAG: hypothetical protein ABIP57_02415 [Jatrophihabitantaceae bacterium]
MRLRFWRKPTTASRDEAIRALRGIRGQLRPPRDLTPGSANDDHNAMQAGMGGYGAP